MVVYGRNVANEMIEFNNKNIRKVFLQNDFNDKSIISVLQKSKLPVFYKSKKEMDNLADGNHQGIILDVMDYQYYNLNDIMTDDSKFFVILDHLEDPHNFGAIIRTCEAAGVDGIIIPQDRQVMINSTVMKTSAGSLIRMKVAKVSNLINTINSLKKNGFWIVGTDMNGEDFKKIDYSGKIALIIGNEGHGISNLVKKSCDFMATIPMYGQINSLNASVASGIMIYEVIRNRK